MVPLISRKARPTQNQAIISRWILVPTGTCASSSRTLRSAIAFHHRYRFFVGHFVGGVAVERAHHSVAGARADFQLYQIRGVSPGVARSTEFPVAGVGRLPQTMQ